jgi:hypothetical protein
MARRLHVGWTSLLFGLALLLYPSVAWAQFDLVTGTVTDPNGIPYSNATVRAQLAIAGAVVNGQPTVTNPSQAQCISAGLGNAPCQMPFVGTQSFTLDVNGNIPNGGISLANNPSVTPAGTQWLFSVTISPGVAPPLGFGPQSFSVPITISSNPQSISATLSAAAPLLVRALTGGTGSVTVFTAGNFSPLFTTAVATPTTTPALSFASIPQNPNSFYAGPTSGGALAPTFRAQVAADLPATTSNCSGQNFTQGLNSGGTPICAAAIGSPQVTGLSNTTLASDVSVTASTVTSVMTRSITFPSSGCPCRVFVSYSLGVNTVTNGVGFATWVSDATNTYGGVQSGQSNAASGGLTMAATALLSPVTYTNSATITFTLEIESTFNLTVKAAPVTGLGPNSSFQVGVIQCGVSC